MKQIIIPFILLSLASCGPSKKELQHQIDIKSDSIFILKQVINEQSSHIEELQEKLDNTKSYVEDVQAALEDGSLVMLMMQHQMQSQKQSMKIIDI